MTNLIIKIATSILFLSGFAPQFAYSLTIGMTVHNAWARSTPPGMTMTAAYFELANLSEKDDSLVGVSSPMARVSVHETVMKNQIASMEERKQVGIQKDAQLAFKPGGLHIMIEGLKAPLKPGDQLPLRLEFKHHDPLELNVIVK